MAARVNTTGRVSKTVRLNRAALDAFYGQIADALAQVGKRAIEYTTPSVPDEPPIGAGLVRTGGYVVYVDGKKVAGNATISRQSKKGIVLYTGYGFPGRFNEIGTIHQPPRPFFTPNYYRAVREMEAIMRAELHSSTGSRGRSK